MSRAFAVIFAPGGGGEGVFYTWILKEVEGVPEFFPCLGSLSDGLSLLLLYFLHRGIVALRTQANAVSLQ